MDGGNARSRNASRNSYKSYRSRPCIESTDLCYLIDTLRYSRRSHNFQTSGFKKPRGQYESTSIRFDGGLSNTTYKPGPSIDLGTSGPNVETPCFEINVSDQKYSFDGGCA